MSDTNNLVILLGASTRAAATSARRAGWSSWCADLFADADLRRIAEVRKIPAHEYPHGLLAALAETPQAPVIYTGGLENRPGLVARLDRELWGNTPALLRAVRSPERWTSGLQTDRIACPAISAVPMSKGRWLLKPRRGAGGLGIQLHAGESFDPRTHFLQEQIDGVPCSGLFLGHERSTCFFGVCQQLVGVPWLNARGFHYAGNIGPLPLDAASAARWHHLGTALTNLFSLRGLFGVDAIVRDGVPWPIEINPRYTAAVELYERSHRMPLLLFHRAAFRQLSMPTFAKPSEPRIWGKAILHARKNFAFPAQGPWSGVLRENVDLDRTDYADIPQAGELIEQGKPVLTLFASGATPAEVEGKLRENAEALDRRMGG